MNSVIAIEELIKTNEERIKSLKNQIKEYDEGIVKASAMAYASAENSLERSQEALEKYRSIYEEMMQKDISELEKEERIKQAIERRNYFKYQKTRIKRKKNLDGNQKLEVMRIIDELPSEISLEDQELFDIAETSIKLDLNVHDELEEHLTQIKEDFHSLLENMPRESIKHMGMLQSYVPILVLHLSVLVMNIEEELDKKTVDTCFRGLPRFQGWWINELWKNHQAYCGLYRWKDIVAFLCITQEQKEAWETIFSNWVFIKKMLNRKGELAFEFNLAFDKVMQKYTGLEEEMDIGNINSMDKIVQNLVAKAKMYKFKYQHKVTTPYYEFKKEKDL